MFAGSLGPDDGVRAAQLEMRARRTIAIAEHIEYGDTAAEVLCRRLSIAARHIQHSVQTMSFAREIQISCGINSLFGDALKLPITLIELVSFQVGLGRNEPRLANGLAVADDFREIQCFVRLRQRVG